MSESDVGLVGDFLPGEEVGPKTESTGNPLEDINNAFRNILSNLGPESELNEELEKALGPNTTRNEALYGETQGDPLAQEIKNATSKIMIFTKNIGGIGERNLMTAFGSINASTLYLFELTNQALSRFYKEGGTEVSEVARTPTDEKITATYLYGIAA